MRMNPQDPWYRIGKGQRIWVCLQIFFIIWMRKTWSINQMRITILILTFTRLSLNHRTIERQIKWNHQSLSFWIIKMKILINQDDSLIEETLTQVWVLSDWMKLMTEVILIDIIPSQKMFLQEVFTQTVQVINQKIEWDFAWEKGNQIWKVYVTKYKCFILTISKNWGFIFCRLTLKYKCKSIR